MMRRVLLLIVPVLCVHAQAWAAQGAVKATIDEGCRPQNLGFAVPAGQRAAGFQVTGLSAGINCGTGVHIAKRGWGISTGNSCRTGDVYVQDVNEDGRVTETRPLRALTLGPGTYCVHVNGGRGANVSLAFNLMPGAGPGGPIFGALDAGGMPACLIELGPSRESAGWVLNSRTPYVVWAARKRAGEAYTAAAWQSYGPWTLTDRRRYIFTFAGGGDLTTDEGATSTELSPALASLGFRNQTAEPVWLTVNPLPPGECRGEGSMLHATINGSWAGPWSNTKGEKGANASLSISEAAGGNVTGLWDGLPILEGRRTGNVVTWRSTSSGRTYSVTFTVSSDGKSGVIRYSVTDPAGTPHSYSGTHTVKR